MENIEYQVRTVEGIVFTITHGEMESIPFAQIRKTKRRRYTVFLRNHRSVRIKLLKFRIVWYHYKEGLAGGKE